MKERKVKNKDRKKNERGIKRKQNRKTKYQ